MVTGIEIRINDKATPALERFMNKKVGKIIAKEVNQQLVEQMKSLAPFWQGNLQKSIEGYQTRDGYNIRMNFYGLMFERGHFIPPGRIPLVWTWAWAKLSGNAHYFLSHQIAFGHRVLPGGYKQQLFIQPSIDYVVSKLEPISVDIVNKTLKESGFK